MWVSMVTAENVADGPVAIMMTNWVFAAMVGTAEGHVMVSVPAAPA